MWHPRLKVPHLVETAGRSSLWFLSPQKTKRAKSASTKGDFFPHPGKGKRGAGRGASRRGEEAEVYWCKYRKIMKINEGNQASRLPNHFPVSLSPSACILLGWSFPPAEGLSLPSSVSLSSLLRFLLAGLLTGSPSAIVLAIRLSLPSTP